MVLATYIWQPKAIFGTFGFADAFYLNHFYELRCLRWMGRLARAWAQARNQLTMLVGARHQEVPTLAMFSVQI